MKLDKILIIILLFVVIVFGILLCLESSDLQQENLLYKTILRTDNKVSLISIDRQKAESYYAEAGFFYEQGKYKLVESNCRLARDYYLIESNAYKDIKSELINSGIEDILINIYINLLESKIEITNNMYEACEYFESASRYYNTYFNTDVDYEDSSFDMANGEIEMMNEKIKAHDKAVEEFNQYLSDYGVELDRRLEE